MFALLLEPVTNELSKHLCSLLKKTLKRFYDSVFVLKYTDSTWYRDNGKHLRVLYPGTFPNERMPEVCVTGSFTPPPKCFWHNIPFLYLKRSYQNHYHSEYSFVIELLNVSHILHVCTFEFQYLLQEEIKGLFSRIMSHTWQSPF